MLFVIIQKVIKFKWMTKKMKKNTNNKALSENEE